ncbi:hypothetical protein ACS3SW_05440 [Roseobacteraceae bacterium S113]
MKHLLALTLVLAPALAQASYGPATDAATSEGLHLTQLAWTSASTPAEPGCTDPTPQPEVFACALIESSDN